MKSSLFEAVIKPLQEAETKLQDLYDEDDFNNVKKTLKPIHDKFTKGNLKASLKKILNNKHDSNELAEQIKAIMKSQALNDKQVKNLISTIKNRPQLFLSSGSEAGLLETMSLQGGRLSICSPDGGITSALTTKQIKDLDILLQAYNMEAYTNTKFNKKDISMKHPALNIVTLTQDETMENLFLCKDLKSKGLLPRFAVWYDSNRTVKGFPNFIQSLSYKPTKEAFWHKYSNIIENNIQQYFFQDNNANIYELSLSHGASSALKKLMDYLESLKNDPEYKTIHAYIEKLRGLTVRLAAAFHLWNSPDNSKLILPLEMKAACNLAKQILQAAKYLYGKNPKSFTSLCIRVIQCIKNNRLTEFKASDISRNLSNIHVEDLEPVFQKLKQNYYISEYISPDNKVTYLTNLKLFNQ